ncbi:MAG TPA: AAA family ATPase [Thermoanaerobaculia bacterium]|nr:AAA family ATPase [Thermoanaerobaculia bacterium]
MPLSGPRCVACGEPSPDRARFCPACGVELCRSQAEGGPSAERRQLTVLFCDLVGSTELSSRLDPEDLRELVSAYQRAADEVIGRFGGHVAQHLGDGLLVYFGWPLAHGNDAERAVRAALALPAAVRNIDTRLEVRVAIHTGTVVVGDLGSGRSTERLALGEVPNVAARVQGEAAPGEVLITAATHRLVAGLFLVKDRGSRSLRGVPQPVELYRVAESSEVSRRPAATSDRPSTPFVGRERERRLLLEQWRRARDGDGQVVVLSGEPGIGKSRLLQQFAEEVSEELHSWLASCCSPFHGNTPLYPVVELVDQLLSDRTASKAQRASSLVASLDAAGLPLDSISREASVPLLTSLLGLPLPASFSPLLASPDRQRQMLFETVADWLLASARRLPVVVVVEDLHWVDSSTAELLELLAVRSSGSPLLLLLTTRPERGPTPPSFDRAVTIDLPPLEMGLVQQLARSVEGATALPPALLDEVVARTDGIPLFVEELTKALLESDGATESREIPTTLHDSLMARLDRLGPGKEAAQVASVLGREFELELLQEVGGQPALADALDSLVGADLLFVQRGPEQVTYTFKHALIRDAAYNSLLKKRRRELHGAAARALAELHPELVADQPELLAYHHTQAGDAGAALPAWQSAADRAIARGAHREAESHLRTALELLATLPDATERDRFELQLQLSLGQAQIMVKSYASEQVSQAYERATELGGRTAEPAQLVFVMLGRWVALISTAGPLASQPIADQALVVAERSGLAPVRTWALWAQAGNHYFAGRFEESLRTSEQALALYDEATALVAPIDPSVAVLQYACLAAWQVGRADRARRYAERTVELARRTGRPADRAYAEAAAGWLALLRRDTSSVREHADALRVACEEQPNPTLAETGAMLSGWALAEEGRLDEGIACLRAALDRYTGELQIRISVEHATGWLAELLVRAGESRQALRLLDQAIASCPGDEFSRAESLRIRAASLALESAPDRDAIEATYRDACATARKQGSKAWELRATAGLAAWLGGRGRGREGRALLAPVVASFHEGLDGRDVREAKQLLAELDG